MTEELIRIRVCGIDKDGAGREYSITVPSGSTAMEAALEGARKFGLQMLPLTIDPNDARRLRAARAGHRAAFAQGRHGGKHRLA